MMPAFRNSRCSIFGRILLVLVFTHVASIASGQEAVEKLKRLLAGFGVHGPLRLQKFVSNPMPRGVTTELIVTDAKEGAYNAFFFEPNRRIIIHRGPEHSMLGGSTFRSLLGTEHERRVRVWMAAVGAKEPTRLQRLTADEKGIGRAYFPILRKGYPFISRPRYGYDFAFDVRSGELLGYEASEQTPPVGSATPKLDKTGALAALKHIWDTQISPEAIKVHHWIRVWYAVKGEPELGWYLAAGNQSATLTWRIAFNSMRDVGSAIQGGDSAMLIDDSTGEQIPMSVMP